MKYKSKDTGQQISTNEEKADCFAKYFESAFQKDNSPTFNNEKYKRWIPKTGDQWDSAGSKREGGYFPPIPRNFLCQFCIYSKVLV